MSYYFEKSLDYWRAGRIEDAIKYFEQCKEQGLFSQEEIEKGEEIIPTLDEQLNESLEDNPKAIFDLYCRIKEKRQWNDDGLCENLGISKENLGKIKNLGPTSKYIVNKIQNEFCKLIIENIKRGSRIIPLLIVFLLISPNLCHSQPKSPLEVVKLFDKAYGGPLMDEIADHTTAKFRDNKPKSVWVVKAHARHFNFHKHPQSYVLQKLSSHDIVFLGTTHKSGAILKFITDLIPRLKDTGTTHLGLEICSDQQNKIDRFIQTGNGLSDIELHPQIDCPEYRSLFTIIRSLDKSKRPTIVALDLPKSMYQGETNRDEWMARSIVKIFHQNPNTKVLGVVGNLHVLKKIEWENRVSNPHGPIRSYLNGLIHNYQMFSIGQLIDESPNECDFTRAFSHLEGAVAMDCNGSFSGWKIGFMFPVAAKRTKVSELLDGVIIF